MEDEENFNSNQLNKKNEKELIENIQGNNSKGDNNNNIEPELQLHNNISDNNIKRKIIEQNKRKGSSGTYLSDNTVVRTAFKKKSNKKCKYNNNKNSYISNNRRFSQEKDKDNYMTNYNLDINSIRKFLNFQQKYMKDENDLVETNKFLQAYSNNHPKEKINPFILYILKNYHKNDKININMNEIKDEEKYTPKKVDKDIDLEFSNINTAETIKTHLNSKIKETNKLINNINSKMDKQINYNFKNSLNIKYHQEKEKDLKLNIQKSNIKSTKTKMEKLHFKSDQELINFVKNKFKEKNSYYLIELKNKSFISNLDEKNGQKEENSEINKLKEENKNMRNKNLKIKKDLEQLEKEMQLINEKSRKLIDDINKKEILIKQYELKIKENKNQIQILKKNCSENKNKENNKNALICKKEMNFILLKNNKINEINIISDNNKLKIVNNFSIFFNKIKLKFFKDKLAIVDNEKLDFISNVNNKDTIKKRNNFSVTIENNINFVNTEIKNEQNKTNNFYINQCQTLNFIGIVKKNTFNSNSMKINNFKMNYKHDNIKEINSKKLNEFIDTKIQKNLDIFYKGLIKSYKNFEIYNNENIYFEKIKKLGMRTFKQNLSFENSCNINFSRLKKDIKALNLKLFIETHNEIFLIGTKKSFDSNNLIPQKNQNLRIEFIYNKKEIKKLLLIKQTNAILLSELKNIYNFKIVKNEIINLMKSKVNNKDILKIISLNTISFIQKNNIFKKFRILEKTNINISLSYNSSNQKELLRHNIANNIHKNDKPQIDNKKQETSNNLNINSISLINSDITHNEIKNNNITEDLTVKKSQKSERLNRAMNRIKRKNQSIIESELIKSESFRDNILFQNKGKSDTLKYSKSGRIMEIAKQLELQRAKEVKSIEENPEENKKENSNIVDIITTAPIIKKKKKKKINFDYDY